MPLSLISATGIDAVGTTELFVDAAAGPEDAQALEASGATALATCQAGSSTIASFRTFPSAEQAQAETAAAVESNKLDAAAKVTSIDGLASGGGSIVMNFDYGRAAAQWSHGPISAFVLVTFDQYQFEPSTIDALLADVAQQTDSKLP